MTNNEERLIKVLKSFINVTGNDEGEILEYVRQEAIGLIRDLQREERYKTTPPPWSVELNYFPSEEDKAPVFRIFTEAPGSSGREQLPDEVDGNRFLIEAAPDLYDVCMRAWNFIHDHVPGESEKIRSQINVAMNKAEGK